MRLGLLQSIHFVARLGILFLQIPMKFFWHDNVALPSLFNAYVTERLLCAPGHKIVAFFAYICENIDLFGKVVITKGILHEISDK